MKPENISQDEDTTLTLPKHIPDEDTTLTLPKHIPDEDTTLTLPKHPRNAQIRVQSAEGEKLQVTEEAHNPSTTRTATFMNYWATCKRWITQLQQKNTMKTWQWIALALILCLSGFLNFYQLQLGPNISVYYAAAVHSMTLSWKNFFFLSYDPTGFVSIDKPPLDLWLQVLSVKLFGFSAWSLSFPQALAGFLSVMLVFLLAYRFCGPTAGLISALAMASMPLDTVIGRTNNLDMMLIFFLLLAAGGLILSISTGKLRWLLIAALLLGLSFNIKAMQAFLVLPAFGLCYLLGNRYHHWQKLLIHIALASIVLLVVSFSWIIAVDATPAHQRPYVESTQTNSELTLTFSYNGIDRLTGSSTKQGRLEYGDPGPLRLFQGTLGGQVAWLLPLALIGLLALIWRRPISRRLDRWQLAALFWGMWLLPGCLLFSVAGMLHDYYLVTLSPSLAALTGCGLVSLWDDYRKRSLWDWRGWMLPGALLLTALVQTMVLAYYPQWQLWLSPPLVILTLAAAGILVIARLQSRRTSAQQTLPALSTPQHASIWQRSALLISILSLTLVPFIWSAIVTIYRPEPVPNVGGPNPGSNPLTFLSKSQKVTQWDPTLSANDRKLFAYIQQQGAYQRFSLASLDYFSPREEPVWILAAHQPVLPLGGFDAKFPVLTLQNLQALVANKAVRFFFLPDIYTLPVRTSGHLKLTKSGRNALDGHKQAVPLVEWIERTCKPVRADLWSTPGKHTKYVSSAWSDPKTPYALFDCAHTN